MIKIRSSKVAVHVNFDYSPPIFEWQNVSSRFFEMIESALAPILGASNLNNFLTQPSNSVGDVAARYNIFGGPSSVTLRANQLSVEFPNLLPSDTNLVIEIVRAVYSGFCEKFSERNCSVIRISLHEHAEVIDGNIQEYLSRYSKPFENSKLNEHEFETQPTGRIYVNSNDGNWSALCMVEKSEILENSLFLQLELTLKLNEDDTFDTILNNFNHCLNSCVSILNLHPIEEE